MNVSLYQAAAAMNANARWQEIVAENLSTGQIPGSRKQDISFAAVQAGMCPELAGVNRNQFVIPSAVPGTNLSQGELRPTNDPKDFAIEGPGFFEIQLPNGDKGYTRNGEFLLNAQNQLITKQGYLVMSNRGPIQLDASNTSPISVSPSGDISQGGTNKGKLNVMEFADPRQLTSIGQGMYLADKPGMTPQTATASQVRQSFLENANMSPLKEMGSLITAMRMFESNQKVLQMQDDRMGRVISDLGNPA